MNKPYNNSFVKVGNKCWSIRAMSIGLESKMLSYRNGKVLEKIFKILKNSIDNE